MPLNPTNQAIDILSLCSVYVSKYREKKLRRLDATVVNMHLSE